MSFEEAQTTKSGVETSPGCIQAALQILGDKWTPLLIGQLADKALPFGELEKKLIGISPRTLSDRLEKLQASEIVSKQQYSANPPRYNYSLTAKGSGLTEILKSMAKWGELHK